MFKSLVKTVFGSASEREVRKLQPIIDEVNALESEVHAMSEADLRGQTELFRSQISEQTRDLRDQLAAARADWLNETDQAGQIPLKTEVERLEKELKEAERAAMDAILPRAFATVREAAIRAIGQRHYDVQLIGGAVLHRGAIAEMKTGEGKTLVATLPLYLNALLGKGCHLVTVNDYLARRDGGWMGRIYHLLGLSVGLVTAGFSGLYDPNYVDPGAGQEDERLVHWQPVTRREAYLADIVYGTNNEFGFDYLRDNIARDISNTVQRKQFFGIVDEVDNILIDEARTPLIISGPAGEAPDQYRRFAELVRRLRPNTRPKEAPPNGHFNLDLKTKSITLTEDGIRKVEEMLTEVNVEAGESLYDPQHYELTHYLDNALRAEYAYHRDHDYVVQEREVIIVDPNTGRLMQGRRYSDGLHEAIEAKEGVEVQRETMTLATVTVQNYFRMYQKLAGMTGTAATEQDEFRKIYNLDVVVIPTNVEHMASRSRDLVEIQSKKNGAAVIEYRRRDRPGEPLYFRRLDYPDRIFPNARMKYQAIIEEIRTVIAEGRPILVGTISVESSELLSKELARAGIEHTVLNAKLHQKEAAVVAQAGRPGAVTISTNMAGRGTDILLGGNAEGLAMQLMEERCFTRQSLGHLARLVARGQVEQARRDASSHAGLSADLVDALLAIRGEFELARQWNSSPLGIAANLVVHRLRPLFGVDETIGRDLARLTRSGLAHQARALAEERGISPEVAPWLSRFFIQWSAFEQAAARDELAQFLADRLYEDHYKVRAALVRSVLTGNLEAAQKLCRETPALPPSLIGVVQEVKRQCAESRQHIWTMGGLHIIGTERHEARRIDNQLRGRAARQGDPGSSQFFIALDDDLMRRFGGERIQGLMERLGVGEDVELPPSGMVSKSIENLQTKAETFNFDMRKYVLEFDTPISRQREAIYSRRGSIIEGERAGLEGEVRRLFRQVLHDKVEQYSTGFENWLNAEIENALAANSNSVTDEVNALAVLQRLSSLMPISQEVAARLADAPVEELRLELRDLAGQTARTDWPDRMLVVELQNTLLFLPPPPDLNLVYAAGRNPIEQRELARGLYMRRYENLLDLLQASGVDAQVIGAQRQSRTETIRQMFEGLSRERPSRQQFDREQQAISRSFSDFAVDTVVACLKDLANDRLHHLVETLFDLTLAAYYVQLGENGYSYLDPEQARAEEMRSLADVDIAELRDETTAALARAEPARLAAAAEDPALDLATADRDILAAAIADRDLADLSDDAVLALAGSLLEELRPEFRATLILAAKQRLGSQAMREYCQAQMLQAIDVFWPQHLTAMEELRDGIGLQAFAQRDPLIEFNRQSFASFDRLLAEIDKTVVDRFFLDLPRHQQIIAAHRQALRVQERLALSGAVVDARGTLRRDMAIGRNDPCWCGSGKKYKHCHMRTDQGRDLAQAAAAAPRAAAGAAAPTGGGKGGPPPAQPSRRPSQGRSSRRKR
jgi:preprotein translocase subunit SecA